MYLDKYDKIINQIIDYSNLKEIYISGRLIYEHSISGRITSGNIDSFSKLSDIGIGFHLFNKEGQSVFISSYIKKDFDYKKLIDNGINMLSSIKKQYNYSNKEIFNQTKILDRIEKEPTKKIENITSKMFQEKLSSFYALLPKEEELTYMAMNSVDYSEYHIFRSDGTTIKYNEFYSRPFFVITSNQGATLHGNLPISDTVLKPHHKEELINKCKKQNNLIKKLINAKSPKAGSYNLIIDYGLAKGLAHEAFGHAAEADGMDNSILSKEGKLNKGMSFENPNLNIIDESIENDWAYCPYSANGIRRKKVEIVKNGILSNCLTDIYSYKNVDSPLTGSARCQDYSSIPYPRMSNTRIELNSYIDVEEDFDNITPQKLYKIIQENKIFKKDEPIYYLSGYKGGQVDTVKGNYVFNCSLIYKMHKGNIEILKPAIFSGDTLETLKSIQHGIGKLKLTAPGLCEKNGQRVHSSGGSHYFLAISKNDNIHLGGN